MIPFKLRKCSCRNFKYMEKRKIKTNIFICWHRPYFWGICNSALIQLPLPPSFGSEILLCVVLERNLVLPVSVEAPGPTYLVNKQQWVVVLRRGQGPAVLRKMCSEVFKGTAEVSCPFESWGCRSGLPTLQQAVRKLLQEARRMRKYSELIHLAPHCRLRWRKVPSALYVM